MSRRRAAQELDAEILRPDSLVWPEWCFDTRRERHHVAVGWKFRHGSPYMLTCDWGDQFPSVGWISLEEDRNVVFDWFAEDFVPNDRLKSVIVGRCAQLGADPQICVGDRAVPRMLSWLAEVFPGAEIIRMRTRLVSNRSVRELRRCGCGSTPTREIPNCLWRRRLCTAVGAADSVAPCWATGIVSWPTER